jgi:hypothetical protein
MQQILTGQTRLPGFHGEWKLETLGAVIEKLVGGGTPSRGNPAFWGNEIYWATVRDFATFHPRPQTRHDAGTSDRIDTLGMNEHQQIDQPFIRHPG